ncbi:MAG: outer membrane protein assembly factor BamB [Burkholderiaceae bacterium]|nr:outer membrane protein assembly factor BamB [Burkholderiaceae bacterium]
MSRSVPRSISGPISRARVALLVLGALALGGCGSFWPWSGPAKPKIPDPPAVSAPVPSRVAWTHRIGPSREGFTPVVAAGSVYAASSQGTVARLDAVTGAVVWQVDLGIRLTSGVGADGSIVAIAARDGTLIALDAQGQRKWSVPLGAEAASVPAVGLGLVLVRGSDNRVQAFDSDTGKRRWALQRQTPPLVLRQTASIAISPGIAYAGLPGGRLVALSLESGALRWEAAVGQPRGATEIERIADVVGSPLVSGREVCAVSYQGRLGCYDASGGRLLWSREVSSARGLDVDARLVVAADDGDRLHAFSRTGSSLWRQDKLARRGVSAPLSIGPVVALGDYQGFVYLLSRDDGAIAARFATDGTAIVAAPVAAGRIAVAQTRGGSLVGIALE